MCRKNPGDAGVAKMQRWVPFGKKNKAGEEYRIREMRRS